MQPEETRCAPNERGIMNGNESFTREVVYYILVALHLILQAVLHVGFHKR